MAVYKVAQDVEADDKLLGPFSFRQFIYLIIVAISMGLAWGLSRISIVLAIIPLPLILLFGALALPLRKDQPMEVYLAALVSFYLKPHRRLWRPDGVESLVEITAPKVVEVQRTKSISESEAERRLSYLADIADSEGWAVRHAGGIFTENSMTSDVYFEAQQTEDILDENGGVSQSLGAMITQADGQRKQDVVARMQQATQMQPAPEPVAVQPTIPIADPYASLTPPTVQTTVQPDLQSQPQFNPYPTIYQSVIQPIDPSAQWIQQPASALTQTPVATASQTALQPAIITKTEPNEQNTDVATSAMAVSPDIINLANNSDLSIETIQREANRIQKKEEDGEVFISLH